MKATLKRTILLLMALIMTLTVLPTAVFAAEDDDTSDDGIVYNVRPVHDANGNGYISAEKYNSAESEHFQMLWGDKNTYFVTDQFIEENLAAFESYWDLYINDLGMSPPSLCTRRNGDQTTHYKVNLIVWGTGLPGYGSDVNEWAAYGGIDADGYAYMMCSRDAMASGSWALPHEFGHATHFAQGFNSWENNSDLGPWYEAIGNWFREQYLYSDYYTGGGTRTDFSPLILRAASLTATNGRAYYEAWPILQYLTENPDNLPGYGQQFVSVLFQHGTPTAYIYDMIEQYADATLEETLGHFAARMATLDFAHQDSYQANVSAQSAWFFWQQFYTKLEPVPNEENTYMTPSERAPQQAAFVVTPLKITGDEISVTLKGATAIEGAGWTACIVTVSGEETSYSELFGDGDTMKVSASGVDEAYLTVAATPDLKTYVHWSAIYDSERAQSFASKPRYPFEAVITGAEPADRTVKGVPTRGIEHPNGGGLVARTAKVDESVYVGPNAMVVGTATVTGNVRIEDNAIVMGNAKISGDAVIDGDAIVTGYANVSGSAHVGDSAIVLGNAKVSGNAQVIESAYVSDNYTVTDNAIAKGLSLCLGSGTLSGQAVADGDFYDDSGLKIEKGTICGYMPAFNGGADEYIRRLRNTKNLHLSYTFNSADDSMTAAEQYGSTYAVVKGAVWEEGSSDTAKGYYTFGKDSSMILDGEALNPRELEIQIAMKRDGGEGNILSFDGRNGSMALTVDANGIATMTLTVGDETVTMTSVKAIPAGEWSSVTLTFADGRAVLTLNDEAIAAADCAITPSDIRADHGVLGGGFEGGVDSIKFYFQKGSKIDMSATPTASADPSGTDGDGNDGTGNTGDGNEGSDSDSNSKGCGSALSTPASFAAVVLVCGVFGCAIIKRREC